VTIPEYIAIATAAGAAVGAPIALSVRAMASALRWVARELRAIRVEFAEVRGQLGLVKPARPGTGGDDAR
jgi:hypothetical protein